MLLPSSIRCPDSPLSPTYCLDMASLAAPATRPEPYCAKEETEGDRSLDSPAAGGLDNTSLVGLGVVRVPAPAPNHQQCNQLSLNGMFYNVLHFRS